MKIILTKEKIWQCLKDRPIKLDQIWFKVKIKTRYSTICKYILGIQNKSTEQEYLGFKKN